MSAGSGTGTPVVSPSSGRLYGEFVTVADVRSRFGNDVDELSDAAIRQ